MTWLRDNNTTCGSRDMKFKKGGSVTINGLSGVHTVDRKVTRFCQSLGRPYYKFILSNGAEYWGEEITAYKPRMAAVIKCAQKAPLIKLRYGR